MQRRDTFVEGLIRVEKVVDFELVKDLGVFCVPTLQLDGELLLLLVDSEVDLSEGSHSEAPDELVSACQSLIREVLVSQRVVHETEIAFIIMVATAFIIFVFIHESPPIRFHASRPPLGARHHSRRRLD